MPGDGTAQRIGCARSPVGTNDHDAVDIAFGVVHVDGGVADQAVAVEGEEIRQARPLDLAPHVFDRQLGDRSPSADLSVVAFISQ